MYKVEFPKSNELESLLNQYQNLSWMVVNIFAPNDSGGRFTVILFDPTIKAPVHE